MANVHVRNLPDAVHRALRERAAHHGRSTEAEIRSILESAVCPPQRVKLGSLLTSIAAEGDAISDADVQQIHQLRDTTLATVLAFD